MLLNSSSIEIHRCLWAIVLYRWSVTLTAEPARREKFLSNGEVKIGIDLDSGGAVFWFSELPADRNLLNHFDRSNHWHRRRNAFAVRRDSQSRSGAGSR